MRYGHELAYGWLLWPVAVWLLYYWDPVEALYSAKLLHHAHDR